MQTVTILDCASIFACVAIVAAVLMLCASPEAKQWAAEVIDRLARFACRELHARAKAQSVARVTWKRIYREERSAGNWTSAAPAASLVKSSAAVEPSSPWPRAAVQAAGITGSMQVEVTR